MKKFFILSVLYLMTVFVKAQTTVSGFVKDTKGNAIKGVSITLKNTYDGATTDSTGRFSFKTTEKGEQVLVFTAIGYKMVEQKINLNTAHEVSVSLKEEINEMKAVVITAGTFEASDRK